MPDNPRARKKRATTTGGAAARKLQTRFERFGPDARALAGAARAVRRHPRLRKELAGTRSRLLDLALVEPTPAAKPKRPVLPNAYRATFYDYTNNRAVHADGVLADLERLAVTSSGEQPLPSREEFDHGVESSGRIRPRAGPRGGGASSPTGRCRP